jgi:hypothetical protein
MKRYSPILFIWLVSLLGSSFITFLTYINGEFNEALAWGTATTFLTNLIIYHFYMTRNEKEDSKIDE